MVLWSGIKTNRCPRTLCITCERVTVTTVMSTISHKLLFVSAHAAFLALSHLLAGRVGVCYWMGQLCLLCSIVLLEGLCSLYLHYRLVNLPTSSLWLCVYCCFNLCCKDKRERNYLEIISAKMYCKIIFVAHISQSLHKWPITFLWSQNVAFQEHKTEQLLPYANVTELTLLFKKLSLEGGGVVTFQRRYAKSNLVYLNISILKWWKLE